jgi:TPR repeat protein
MSTHPIYLLIDHKVCGPFDSDIILHMLESCEVNGETRALISGHSQWVTLNEIIAIDSATAEADPIADTPKRTEQDYARIPFYRKKIFFWFVYILLPPLALLILIFGDIHYLKHGKVKKFGLANRITAILILLAIGYAVALQFKALPGLPSDNISDKAREFYPDAEKGDAAAMVKLYLIYSEGLGVKPDNPLALSFLRLAVEKNDTEAQAILGYLCHKGEGVKKDLESAVKLFELAAEKGNVDAQNNLGNMLYFGQGTAKDLVKAAALYEKAANQNDVNASAMLGGMLLHGEGVQKDRERALRLLIYGAQNGHVIAQFNLGCLYLTGNENVNQSIDKALALLKEAADKKMPDALEKLGTLYEEGNLVPRDLNLALKYYDQLIALGDDLGLMAQARIYQKGLRGEKSEMKAIEFYEKAVSRGIFGAGVELGLIYYNREGSGKALDKTTMLLKQAVDARSSYAMLLLGLLYLKGEVPAEYSFKANPDLAICRFLNGPHSAIATLEKSIATTASLCREITKAYPKGKPLSLDGHEMLIQQGIWKAANELVSFVQQLKKDEFVNIDPQLGDALDDFLKMVQTNIGYNEYLVLSALEDLEKKIKEIKPNLIGPKRSSANSIILELNPKATAEQRSFAIANAIELFKMSIEENSSSASKFNLALMLKDGVGFPPDLGKAVTLLEHSARQGYTSAMLLLGSMYQAGDGVNQDLEKAKQYYRDAAEKKDPLGYLHLGLIFEFGQGSSQDLERARELYEKAANEGIQEAFEGLKRLSQRHNPAKL